MNGNELSDWIANQSGASGGLWTHTPVDWAGNQDLSDPELEPPADWPADAYMTDPDEGHRPPITDPVPPVDLSFAELDGQAPPQEGPDNTPTLNDSQIYAEFRRPDGRTAWQQKHNRAVYEAKGYVLTGAEFNVEAYNDQVRELDRFRAIDGYPGETRVTWPPQGAT
jgi:hypothetical protein